MNEGNSSIARKESLIKYNICCPKYDIFTEMSRICRWYRRFSSRFYHL